MHAIILYIIYYIYIIYREESSNFAIYYEYDCFHTINVPCMDIV